MTFPRVLKSIYSSVPLLRPLLAGAYGYRLRMRRYGGAAEALADAALERDTWTADQWRGWQQQELARMLWHASRRVPYYRDHWNQRRQRGDRSSVELITNWPVLEKSDIRTHFQALRVDRSWIRGSEVETTSGTTGNPLQFIVSRSTVRSWYALCEARFRSWNGISRHDRWAMIGAQLVTPVSQTKPPFWVWNAGLNQLYMSAYHLTPDNLPGYLEAIREARVQYLWGHSSALDALARAVRQRPELRPRLRVILSSSEPLTQRQRSNIEEAFQCPVRSTYGMSEMVIAASECSEGRKLHLWPDAGYSEVLVNDTPVPPGVAGDLVATCLVNWDMPLIRYRVGDRVTLEREERPCACGRCLPVLGNIEGRISEMLYTATGASISPSAMEAVFDFDAPIAESQIIQESLHLLRVRYVPLGGPSQAVEDVLRSRIQARIGDIEVLVEPVVEIPRGPNGKFRAVICRLRPEDIPSVSHAEQGKICARTA